MVLQSDFRTASRVSLSVLALSSRFDGLRTRRSQWLWRRVFQYSLCRVVLMVRGCIEDSDLVRTLSVLALSSRFDGREVVSGDRVCTLPFSTRSVESF